MKSLSVVCFCACVVNIILWAHIGNVPAVLGWISAFCGWGLVTFSVESKERR